MSTSLGLELVSTTVLFALLGDFRSNEKGSTVVRKTTLV
jgi:hypothetical protein